MKIAIISYNNFVQRETNGWKNNGDNSVLLIQNEKQLGRGRDPSKIIPREIYDEMVETIDPLWKKLQNELAIIDKVVLYVGREGAEHFITLAAKHGLEPNRIIFVLCACNKMDKLELIRGYGFDRAKIIFCECGGNETMYNIYNFALTVGKIPN